MAHPGGRPLKFATPEIMQTQIDDYFTACDEGKLPYTITGLALALDTTRDILIDYAGRAEFTNTIKKAKMRCENYAERLLLSGNNAAGAIFALKNYGWRDKHEIEHGGSPDLLAALRGEILQGGEGPEPGNKLSEDGRDK